MITSSMIFVAIFLLYSHNICGLKLREVDIENIYKNTDTGYQKPISNEINNENLITLINKVVQDLYKDESQTKRQRIKAIQKSFVRPRWLKLQQEVSNDKLHGVKGNEFYEDARTEPKDPTKVYLILNSERTLSSSDVKDLTNLVSLLLSKSELYKKSKNKHKTMKRYKGFLMSDKRRRFKESKEMFAKGSIEHDYKPKRVRSDYGGGRTAIPYIRHRGDIYEKD